MALTTPVNARYSLRRTGRTFGRTRILCRAGVFRCTGIGRTGVRFEACLQCCRVGGKRRQLFRLPTQRLGGHGRDHADLHHLIEEHLRHAELVFRHGYFMRERFGKTGLE